MLAFEARCGTTAMGIMPHSDVGRALELALGLDIPFWPQLPKVGLYEDMYVQASQNFPGIAIDFEDGRLSFDTARFQQELDGYFEKMEAPETFTLTAEYSAVFHRFLTEELGSYKAIRGQVIGPVSFGFKVLDEKLKPIIYNDEARGILFDFIRKKANVQYRQLKEKNPTPLSGWMSPALAMCSAVFPAITTSRQRKIIMILSKGWKAPKGYISVPRSICPICWSWA
jgi:hypothetical protein